MQSFTHYQCLLSSSCTNSKTLFYRTFNTRTYWMMSVKILANTLILRSTVISSFEMARYGCPSKHPLTAYNCKSFILPQLAATSVLPRPSTVYTRTSIGHAFLKMFVVMSYSVLFVNKQNMKLRNPLAFNSCCLFLQLSGKICHWTSSLGYCRHTNLPLS